MKARVAIFIGCLLLLVVGISSVMAAEGEYPWQNHAPPYDFLFGNMIDSHQQTRLSKKDTIKGFIYIHYTGEYTEEGYPIAQKAQCPKEPCNVGWSVKGVKIDATLVCLNPRTWLVDAGDLPREKGYTHFHWLGPPHSPHGHGPGEITEGLIVGQTYPGYLMKRVATSAFWWTGGENSSNPGHLVSVGLDPHSNITLVPNVQCGGHDDGGHDGSDDGGGCGEDHAGGCGGHSIGGYQ